jgi:N-acetylneuraminate synthase
MSTRSEINTAACILDDSLEYMLHTTSSYPTPNIEMNMKKILTLKQFYGDKCKIGFSNHCADIIYTIQAYLMGAEMLEFHITLDRNLQGTDQWASIGPTGLDKIMKHLNNIVIGYGDGEIKLQDSELQILKKLRG